MEWFWLPVPASSIPVIMTIVMADADCSRPASYTIVTVLLGIVVVIGLANVPAHCSLTALPAS